MKTRRVLVTGLSGVVGSAVRPALETRHAVASLSRGGAEGLPAERNHRADIADLDAILPAFKGVDSVVHLAAEGGARRRSDAEADWVSLLRNNIVGTYNVFEAARRSGVRRVVYASSGAAVSGYEKDSAYRDLVSGTAEEAPRGWRLLGPDCEPRPATLYGVTKLFGEDLARYYVESSSLSIICLRLGSVTPDDRPRPGRGRAVWCSHRDAEQAVVRAVEAPETLRFDVLFVNSANRMGYRDLDPTRRALGFDPQSGA